MYVTVAGSYLTFQFSRNVPETLHSRLSVLFLLLSLSTWVDSSTYAPETIGICERNC